MHIGEGVLAATRAGQGVLLAGTVAAAAGTMIGLRRLDEDQIPKAAVLGSAFFVVSAIRFPWAQRRCTSCFSGLMGLVLGWSIFPTVLVAPDPAVRLLSIAGPTVLGINTLIMSLPGLICYYLFRESIGSDRQPIVFGIRFRGRVLRRRSRRPVVGGGTRHGGQVFVALAAFFLSAPYSSRSRRGFSHWKRGCLAAASSAGGSPRITARPPCRQEVGDGDGQSRLGQALRVCCCWRRFFFARRRRLPTNCSFLLKESRLTIFGRSPISLVTFHSKERRYRPGPSGNELGRRLSDNGRQRKFHVHGPPTNRSLPGGGNVGRT